MSASDLDSEITKKEGEIAAAESKFKVLTYNKTRAKHALKSKHMLLQAHPSTCTHSQCTHSHLQLGGNGLLFV